MPPPDRAEVRMNRARNRLFKQAEEQCPELFTLIK